MTLPETSALRHQPLRDIVCSTVWSFVTTRRTPAPRATPRPTERLPRPVRQVGPATTPTATATSTSRTATSTTSRRSTPARARRLVAAPRPNAIWSTARTPTSTPTAPTAPTAWLRRRRIGGSTTGSTTTPSSRERRRRRVLARVRPRPRLPDLYDTAATPVARSRPASPRSTEAAGPLKRQSQGHGGARRPRRAPTRTSSAGPTSSSSCRPRTGSTSACRVRRHRRAAGRPLREEVTTDVGRRIRTHQLLLGRATTSTTR